MWIKLIITIVTLFLLFDEYFKVIDKIKKRNRRRIVLVSLAILSIFSLIDVIIEVNDGNNLVKKANEIIFKSDTLISNTNTIITDLENNIEVVEESGKSIIAIDSVLKGVRDSVSSQVEILKEAAGKSAELVRLGEKKFKQDEAKMTVFNNEIKLINSIHDSTFFDIKYSFRNLGNRHAIDIKFSNKVFVYNKVLNTFQSLTIPEVYFSDIISNTSKGDIKFRLPRKKTGLIKDYYMLILILKSEYKDAVSNKVHTYINHFIAEEIKSSDTDFKLIVDYDVAEKINIALINEKMNNYLIDSSK